MVILTELIKGTPFKNLTEELDLPETSVNDIQAKPPREYQGMEYALIGTAIEQLLKYEIKRETPNKPIYERDLNIAEGAELVFGNRLGLEEMSKKAERLVEEGKYDSGSEAMKNMDERTDEKIILDNCIKYCNNYVDKNVNRTPLQEVVELARCEHIRRNASSKWIVDYLGNEDKEYQSDLNNMLELSDEIIDVKQYAVFEPVMDYEAGSETIKAFGDMIIDDMLIDIKTTVSPSFDAEYWNQLIGYLTLLDIAEENNEKTHNWNIRKPDQFGVFFSRSGQLISFDSDIIYDQEEYTEIKEFMRNY